MEVFLIDFIKVKSKYMLLIGKGDEELEYLYK